ncbi:hypothetical protein AMC94_04865 [Pseudomonas amygdali pv. aesculi]|nr:hypothetical protein AL041_22905 [Pseudomonas amygdali pv. aesculi]KWT19427.1 hypothetical protein AL043_04025 [Pseudomonas amygdali pv. aesculi]KWT20323.1 hypothetical protein AL042_25925 [Pseudomonas amygdali pv. aesculi]KWT32120.1 hypothetical protein AMC94_04865 [Pseudomonas amygdali pv. aesculi]KWT32247.1 hypothetical protein AL044_09860 [Pseudomonas amygdali pv. aesculi]
MRGVHPLHEVTGNIMMHILPTWLYNFYVGFWIAVALATVVGLCIVYWAEFRSRKNERDRAYDRSMKFFKLECLLGQRFGKVEPMTDNELRLWGMSLLTACPDSSELVTYGVSQQLILEAQSDAGALSELRRWAEKGTKHEMSNCNIWVAPPQI